MDTLNFLLLFITPVVVSYLAVRWFCTHVYQSAEKAAVGVVVLGLVLFFEFLLYYSIPFPVYRVYIALGYLVVTVMVCWVLNEPAERISKEKKGSLVFVLAVILITSPFCLYILNSFDPYDQERAKVARAKSEIRNLAVALETYYIDNNTYPPAMDEVGQVIPFASEGVPVSSGYVTWMLTTPVVHTNSLPQDPFRKRKREYWQKTYRYATDGGSCWIVASQGPDLDADMTLADYIRDASCDIGKFLSQYGGDGIEYDPTNGVLSSGDVFRTGP